MNRDPSQTPPDPTIPAGPPDPGLEKSGLLEQAGEVVAIAVDSAAIAILGMRRAITEARAEQKEKKAAELDIKAKVYKEVAEAAFYGILPSEEFAPRTRWEQRAARRASRRRTRVMVKTADQGRLKAHFGSTDSQGGPFMLLDKDGKRVIDGNNFKRPIPLPNDLATHAQLERLEQGRYSRSATRAEMNAARQFTMNGFFAQNTQDQIQKSIEGRDMPGRVLGKRRERAVERRSELLNKANELDDRKTARETRKINRQATRQQRKTQTPSLPTS